MKHQSNTNRLQGGGKSASEASIVPSELTAILFEGDEVLRRKLWQWELAGIALLLALFNAPLLAGGFSTRFIYHPVTVVAGEWWRVLTHPLVHVSPYHLALDAAAFFLAYSELRHWPARARAALLLAAAIGGLLAAVVASPLVATHGLCGLSGVAHGLMAIVGLESMRRGHDGLLRWGGAMCFVGVVGKGLLELATGNALFASLHLGSLGTPIAACHAGGILGALCVWLFASGKRPAAYARPVEP